MTIYRIVVQNSTVEELYGESLETIIKWHEETTKKLRWHPNLTNLSQMQFINNCTIGGNNDIRSDT